MNIYIVYHKVDIGCDCDCIHADVTFVTTDINKLIQVVNTRDIPYKVEIWRDGEYIGEVDESHFELPEIEWKELLLKGGI